MKSLSLMSKEFLLSLWPDFCLPNYLQFLLLVEQTLYQQQQLSLVSWTMEVEEMPKSFRVIICWPTRFFWCLSLSHVMQSQPLPFLLHTAIDLLSPSEIHVYFDNHSFRKRHLFAGIFYIIRFINKIIMHGALWKFN